MIFSTFNDFKGAYDYAVKREADAKTYAVKYLVAVLREVGSITVQDFYGGCSVLIRKGEDVFILRKIDDMTSISECDMHALLELCGLVHKMHLVDEWGESKEEENKANN